jgi:3-ketosteroid 9alpha-monooxygenase subunit B
VIFAEGLGALASQYADRLVVMHWLESVQGVPNPSQLATMVAPCVGHESFVCGPGAFMDTVHAALATAGVAPSRVHTEVFRSLSGDPFSDPDIEDDLDDAVIADVELDGQRHRLRWPRQATLVDVMITAGVDVPYSCREGHCGSCACTLVAGEVEMAASDVLEPDDRAAGLILACQARPITDEVTIQF